MEKSANSPERSASSLRRPASIPAKVKKETIEEDIKEYAETTMNELLGWYGYGASREEKISRNCQSNSNSNSSDPDSPRYAEGCGWCGKPVEENVGLTAGSNAFCSELCFSQSRRANFKKNKTCDWCRHVRHTVSYVDFQDGASQLQFCSDKCLNQYKMHIFCRETRAHLELHPHLPIGDTGTGLITPELWMKNCKSPESKSPSPPPSTTPNHPPPRVNAPQTSPLPLITVAHPSKLMASTNPEENRARVRNNKSQRKQRKRCYPPASTTLCNSSKSQDLPQDLRVRHTPETTNTDLPPIYPPDPRWRQPAFIDQSASQQKPPPPVSATNFLPPTTILVPYPILIPVPLPIPIPLPLKSFIQAEQIRKERDTIESKNTKDTKDEPPPPQLEKANGENDDVTAVEAEEERHTENEKRKNGDVRPLRKRKKGEQRGLKKKPLTT